MSDYQADLLSLLPAPCGRGATLLVGGNWQAARSGSTLDTLNPSTGKAILAVARGAAADVDAAVAAAKEAAPRWAQTDPYERARIMRRTAELIRQHRAALGSLDTANSGRTVTDTMKGSPESAARMFEFFAGVTDRIRGATVEMGPGRTGLIEREPCGVMGAISPWNYPMTNAVTKIAPIIACGNTLVLKPSEHTPLSALLIGQLLLDAGLPPGVVNIVTGLGEEAGAALVEHPDIARIAFTGSTMTGRRIAAKAGQSLKQAVLELGGRCPLVVFDDADIDAAAGAAVMTAFMNNGQTCTACCHVLVAETVRDRFTSRVRELTSGLRIGDPTLATTQLGPMVSEAQLRRVERLVADALAAGAKQLDVPMPGYRPMAGGFFFRPAIVLDLPPDSALAREEVFGPLMTIRSFADDADAYRLAGESEYGLAASVWTASLARAEAARRVLDAGIVWINCAHVLSFGLPVPPHRASGMGSEFGLEIVDQYMRLKTTVTMASGFRGLFG
jgi:acyl-CoA reductase-like NAD-dependent aldehyde dehydrogenase